MTLETLERAPAAAAAPAPAPAARDSTPCPLPAKVLRFRLGEGGYALDIQHVREIRSFELPTRVPGSNDEMRGVIDLRGTVVPVIDLRRRLGLQPECDGGAVVVAELHGRLAGLVVDAVDDVHDLQPSQLRPVPPLRVQPARARLQALIADEGALVQLLDAHGLFGEPSRT